MLQQIENHQTRDVFTSATADGEEVISDDQIYSNLIPGIAPFGTHIKFSFPWNTKVSASVFPGGPCKSGAGIKGR